MPKKATKKTLAERDVAVRSGPHMILTGKIEPPTIEEVLKLVSFVRVASGEWMIDNVLSNVYGNVQMNVNGKVFGKICGCDR